MPFYKTNYEQDVQLPWRDQITCFTSALLYKKTFFQVTMSQSQLSWLKKRWFGTFGMILNHMIWYDLSSAILGVDVAGPGINYAFNPIYKI